MGSIQYSPKIVTDSLVLYLDAANVKSYIGSGTSWYDLSGNGNTGTLSTENIGTVSGSGVMAFNGSSDYIQNTNTNNLISSVGSISYWIKKRNISDSNTIFHIHEYEGAYTDYLRSHIDSNNLMDIVIEDGDDAKLLFTYDLDDLNQSIWVNNWMYVMWTQDGSTLKLYINGSYINETANTWWTSHLTGIIYFKIGYGWNYLEENISNFMIYNKALSSSEVLQNYNALRSRYGI